MLAVERQNYILQVLQREGIVKVSDLSKKFEVSEETIRRDLSKLESRGGFTRTYGGAYITTNVNPDIHVNIRKDFLREGKSIIGEICASLVEDGDTIILDSSTTALYIAERILKKENLTVVTDALKVALTLSESSTVKVVCIGGTVRNRSLSFVGPEAELGLSRYFVDKAFVSCTSVDMDNGLTDTNEYEANIRSLMIKQASKRILIADTTKFGKTAFSVISPLTSFDTVVTDKPLAKEWANYFEKEKIVHLFGESKEKEK